MGVTLKVDSKTTLAQLDQFAQEAGEGAKIRAKKDSGGGVTLYASTKKEGRFDWLLRLFGMGRQDKREAGQQAIESILRQTAGQDPGLQQRLLGNVFEGRRDGGGEMRTEHLRDLVKTSQVALEVHALPEFIATGEELVDKIGRAREQAPKRREDLDSVSVTMVLDMAQGLRQLRDGKGQAPLDRIPSGFGMDGDGELRLSRPDRVREVQPQDEKQQVWDMGLMTWKLMLGSPGPFDQPGHLQEFQGGVTPILWTMKDWFPDDPALHARIDKLTPFQARLINDMLHPDPGRRPTLDELVEHPALHHGKAGSSGARQYIRQLNDWY
jgi:hypothetical protein